MDYSHLNYQENGRKSSSAQVIVKSGLRVRLLFRVGIWWSGFRYTDRPGEQNIFPMDYSHSHQSSQEKCRNPHQERRF